VNTEDSLGTKNPEFPSVRSQYKLPMAWVKMSVAKNAKIPSKAKNLMMRRIEPNAQGKRRRSTEGAQGTNKGHENAEGMALVGVRLTAQLGHGPDLATLRFNPILERRIG